MNSLYYNPGTLTTGLASDCKGHLVIKVRKGTGGSDDGIGCDLDICE